MEIKFDTYGKRIMDEITEGNSNIVVQACAGAGKTTLIVEGAKKLPKTTKILICCFNKNIKNELKDKLPQQLYKNIDITTFHGLGYKVVKENNHRRIGPNILETKYASELNEVLIEHEKTRGTMGSSCYWFYLHNILRLIDYARFNMSKTVGDIEAVAQKYSIHLIDDECYIALEMLEWGKANCEDIDFGDMIWLPYELDYKTENQYDFIFIDEAQDTSPVQQKLVLKCLKAGGRFLAAGETNQCINAWAGADEEAFNSFLKIPNTIMLTLPVSRRCPKEIVKEAQKVVPEIMPFDEAIDGSVERDVSPTKPQSGDMVLCRNIAPLFKLYDLYLKINKKAYIVGDELEKNFLSLLNNIPDEELSINIDDRGVFFSLYKMLFERRDEIMKIQGLTDREALTCEEIYNLYSTIHSLETLSQGLRTKTELIEKIKIIFDNSNGDGVKLSTIHKAKGDEENNVFILGASLIPSRLAKQPWEIVAEKNLQYVAITRAKKTLSFISEKAFSIDNAFKHLDTYYNRLKEIEKQCEFIGDNKRYSKKKCVNTAFTEDGRETKIPSKKIGGNKYKLFME